MLVRRLQEVGHDRFEHAGAGGVGPQAHTGLQTALPEVRGAGPMAGTPPCAGST